MLEQHNISDWSNLFNVKSKNTLIIKIYLPICLSIYLSIYLSINLSIM